MVDLKIRGKVAVVTGGASGIGEAISLSLGKEGALKALEEKLIQLKLM